LKFGFMFAGLGSTPMKIRKSVDWLLTIGPVIILVGIAYPTISSGACREDTRIAISTARDYQQAARDVVKVCTGSEITACSSSKGELESALDSLGTAHLAVMVSCQGTTAAPLPSARGDLVITEIMVAPLAVRDPFGEWIELYNASGGPLNLEGLEFRLRDFPLQGFTIGESLVVANGEFVVLGNNANVSTNGGIPVDYEYSTYALSNAGDQILIYSLGGQQGGGFVIDEADWPSYTTQTQTIIPGRAGNLDPGSFDADSNDGEFFAWCAATTLLPGGDYGTPGSTNIDCPP
jgi:hypothetical protein